MYEIKLISEKERSKVIEAKLETYHLGHDNLTREQKYRLVRRVIEEKANRFKIIAVVLVVMSLIFTTATVFILQQEKINKKEEDLMQHKIILYPMIANQLQNELSETGISTGGRKNGRVVPDSEYQITPEDEYYNRLRKAIFLNLLSFQANNEILEGTLNLMIKQGFNISQKQINRLLFELDDIKKYKLRWLEDSAIPSLREDIKKLSRLAVQRSAQACVDLPKIA